MFRFLPEQASDFAHKVDWINNLITDISVFFTVAIVGAMIYFAIVYRRRNGTNHETPQIRGSHFLEIVWTVVPTLICIFVAYYGVIYFRELREPPKDTLNINVSARQWDWDFQYDNGKKTFREFVVPVDQAVKLVMTSRDVLHSFFIPSMRVKQDVVPGQYTNLWFRPIKTGDYNVFCTEYCGKDHSTMLAKLKVVPADEYKRWVNDRSEEAALMQKSPAEQGADQYNKLCKTCHSMDGSKIIGPSFLKLFGKEEKLVDGSTAKVDENYLKESMLNPGAKIVEGFQNVMPSFAGQLTDPQIEGLIAFIKTVDGTQKVVMPEKTEEVAATTPVDRGKNLYSQKACIGCHSLDGSKLVGPTFKGIYGRKGKLADGTEYEANDAYITNSIKEPNSQVVEGFAPAMPQMPMSDEEIKDIIEFLKTVK